MKTTYLKGTEMKDKDVAWHLVDAKNQVLGHLACKVARLINGKHKIEWSPHINCGDFVIIVNAAQIHLSGKKWDQKTYYSHSRYVGSLKEKKASNMKPEDLIVKAVQGMLPKNKLRSQMLKKLKVYVGEIHPHQAQNPLPFEL